MFTIQEIKSLATKYIWEPYKGKYKKFLFIVQTKMDVKISKEGQRYMAVNIVFR